MKRLNLYTTDGWVNAGIWFQDPAPFVVALGGRGIGKTFGALDYLTAPETGQKHIYMRRTQAQIDACKIPELNPYKSVNAARGRQVLVSALGKYTAGIYNGEVVDGVLKAAGEPIGIGIALSVFANIRGVDGMGYKVLLFDEALKEAHERPFAHEGEALLNAYETLNRNRELQGQAPLKLVLLSNTNDLSSPLLDALGIVGTIDKMQKRGKEYASIGRDLSIYLYKDSPISERKRNTALYRVASSADFTDMALDNKFSAANYEYVRTLPLREYVPVVTVGNVTVFSHVNNGTFYVVDGVKSTTRFTTLPIDLKGFRKEYYYLYEALLSKRLYYSTATAKVQFEKVWR